MVLFLGFSKNYQILVGNFFQIVQSRNEFFAGYLTSKIVLSGIISLVRILASRGNLDDLRQSDDDRWRLS